MNQVSPQIEVVFRKEYSKLLAVLLARFGGQHLELIEDSVQDAIEKAITHWGFDPPKNPGAWLNTVATNKIIDRLRVKQKHVEWQEENETDGSEPANSEFDSIRDPQLQMMFACCDPSLNSSEQLLLSLRYLCGFGISEISRALLKSNDAVEKALGRAKHKFRSTIERNNLHDVQDVDGRINMVLRVIYLQFNEGYKASKGSDLINVELCRDAILLCEQIVEADPLKYPEANALLSLMCFQSSRFKTRVSDSGELLTLEHQDRKKWDQIAIQKGMIYLGRSYASTYRGEYYLQAAIAAYHCAAKAYEATPWSAILEAYDALIKINHNPTYMLNRLIVVSKISGAEAALEGLRSADKHFPKTMVRYAFEADLLSDLNRLEEAKELYQLALSLANTDVEKQFINEKLLSLV